MHNVIFDYNIASLIMEYVESDFKLVINDVNKPENDALLCHYFFQLFSGVDYLHKINIMHRVTTFNLK